MLNKLKVPLEMHGIAFALLILALAASPFLNRFGSLDAPETTGSVLSTLWSECRVQ